ncbi:hypothetical protein FO519_006509 [Halicephalobus sp. NKZ332]|nr:hypothetical protein FO519_006509 [Halicephalobus sp. NKZ332]
MCLSYFGKVVYGILIFITLGITAVALFTPGWRHFSKKDSDKEGYIGLVDGCKFPDENEASCDKWWDDRPKWEQAAKTFFYLAMALEIIALGWIGMSYILCCFHKRFMHVLPLWSVLITAFLVAGLAIFYGKYKNDAGLITDNSSYEKLEPGYSATIMDAACGLALISIALAVTTSFFADRTCC